GSVAGGGIDRSWARVVPGIRADAFAAIFQFLPAQGTLWHLARRDADLGTGRSGELGLAFVSRVAGQHRGWTAAHWLIGEESSLDSSDHRGSGSNLTYDARQFRGTQHVPQQAPQLADDDQHQLLAVAADPDDLHLAVVLRGPGGARSGAQIDHPRPCFTGFLPS